MPAIQYHHTLQVLSLLYYVLGFFSEYVAGLAAQGAAFARLDHLLVDIFIPALRAFLISHVFNIP
jgi:hypothetical protein